MYAEVKVHIILLICKTVFERHFSYFHRNTIVFDLIATCIYEVIAMFSA